jgi:hypothetical protein
MKKQLLTGAVAFGTVAFGSLIQMSPAEAISFTGSGTNPDGNNNLSAIADFQVDNGDLKITLTNNGDSAERPSDILTAIFWDIAQNPNLTYDSGTAPTVTSFNSNPSPQNDVNLRDVEGNEEWRYAFDNNNLSGLTQSYGLGTAGFDVFNGGGGGQQFQYGIVNGVNSNAKNKPTKDAFLVNNTAMFSLSNLPNSFDINDISNVRFQYGTSLGEPSFSGTPSTPVPTPALLPGLIGMGVASLRKKKKQLSEIV